MDQIICFLVSKGEPDIILEVIPNDQNIFVSSGSLQKGCLDIIVKASETAKIGSSYTLRAQLEIEGGVYILPPTERKCEEVWLNPEQRLGGNSIKKTVDCSLLSDFGQVVYGNAGGTSRCGF